MASPTETYVDPSIAGNSGTGTAIDPYGDLQYALNTMTRDATNGDRINIKAGTDEILAAALSLAAYGTPGYAASLTFQGYTATAGDRGIGGVNGNSFAMLDSYTLDYISLIDLHIHHCGTRAVRLDDYILFYNLEVDNGVNGLDCDYRGLIIDCYVHDMTGIAIKALCPVVNCVIVGDGTDYGIHLTTAGGTAINNVISIAGIGVGIRHDCPRSTSIGNTIYSNGGTGDGIQAISNYRQGVIIGNYIEGFSGGGGVGVNIGANYHAAVYGHNYTFNNATNYVEAGEIFVNLGNNTALGASALADPGSGDFSVDTTLQALGWPAAFKGISTNTFIDVGAAQREEAGAAGMVVHPGMAGGARG